MKKISLILLFLGILLLPIAATAAITGDACSPSDHNDTFAVAADSTTYNGTLAAGASTSYYFTIQTAGTLTLTPSSAGDKVAIAVSANSCPSSAASIATQTITVTESTDINVLLYASQARTYTLTAVFTPAPMTILKTATPAQVAQDTDSNVTYTLKVNNNTNSPLTDLTITDTLPNEVIKLLGISPDGICSGDSEITCQVSSLAANSSITINMNVTVNAADDFQNTAEVEASDEEKVSSTAIIRAVSGKNTVDLELQKYAEADSIPPDTPFTYVIFVVNHSQGDADLVRVTDEFPLDQNVSFIGYDNSTGWTCTTPTAATNNTFTCDFDRPLEHEITYFTISARTNAGDYNTTAVNKATVSALNPISGDHNLIDTAIINIETNASYGGGTLGGKYVEGGSIEVSDITLPPNTDRNNARIQTKVASTGPMTLNTYFVDYQTDLTTSYTSDATKVVPVTVLLKLADKDCTVASETYLSYDASPVAAIFNVGDSMKYAGSDPQNGVTTFKMRNIAQKNAKIIMKYVDINKVLDYSGESCSVSTLSGNIKGLPQCIANSAGSNKFDNNKYINVFGIEAFIRCNIQNGRPCSSENGGYGNDPYNNEYGCYECTVGNAGYCSNDNFAIRPKAFDVNISNGDFFRAGKNYSLAFKGLTADTAVTDETTLDYNETQNTTFRIDADVLNNTNCQEKNISILPNVEFQDGLDNGPFKFDDIGDINFTIHEQIGKEFAKIDENDTNDAQRYIEDYNVTFTIIPDHFDINATLIDHNNDTNLTYLHDINRYDNEDNYTMAAKLTIDIKAEGEDNITTSNYTEGCYAKDTNLTLGLDGTDIIYPGSSAALTHFLYYNPVQDDNNANTGEGNYTLPAPVVTAQGNVISLPTLPIENIASSFPENAPDGNGTTHIEYKLNFDRKIHLVANPVRMSLSDVNITEIDPTIINPDNLVKGNTGTLIDQNATFYFARTRASKFFYEDISEATVNTPIMVDIYCDLGFTACDTLGVDTVNGQINEINWWLSLGHNTGNNDGVITLVEGNVLEGTSANWSVTPNVNITANAMDPNIVVNRGAGATLPLTVEIDLDDDPTLTNRWLIYNPDTDNLLLAPPSPLYKVRFIGTSGWAGHGDTGHVVDSNTSVKKNRRLGW